MDQREWDYGARMSRDRRAAEAWPIPEPEIDESGTRWSALTDTGSMTPSPEALTWQRRADAWAQQSEVEPYSGGGQAVEPANRWSDVASTGRPTFPADGAGWRTQTSEWRATGARWRQTTEWRSSTGSHVWRSTTEAWRSENEAETSGDRPGTPERPTISGTAWPTPALESGRESSRDISSSWSETPSWRRDADPPGRAATTPVEQTWSSSSTPSWQQPSTQTPSWQQSGQTPSWQQPAQTPSWQQPSPPTPSWQQRPADSWSSSAPASGSWSAESATPSSSWDTGRRSPGENTTDSAGWGRSDGPGWQSGPRDDGRHFVREDDRAAWRRADDEWSTRRGRRRAPEPDEQPSGGTGWSGTSDRDNWAGHDDTGNILAPGSPVADPGPPAPSWGSRSLRRDSRSDDSPRRGYSAETPSGAYGETSGAYGERNTGQTPIQYGVRPPSARRAPDDTPSAGPSGPSESPAASGGLPERQRAQGQQGRRAARTPQRYNANPTNWREDTRSWEAEPDTSNWTRDPDTGQWSRGEEDPRVLAWRAEAARREQMRKAEGGAPAEQSPGPDGWGGGGRRGRRDDEPTGPVGGVPGGPLPADGMPDGPGARQRSAMPAPRSAVPSQGSGGWSTAGAMPGPATPRSAMPGGTPWTGADQPDPSTSGRFRSEQYESGPYPAQRGAPEAYPNENGGRRRAPEPEPEAWPGRQARRDDDYATEGWRQGPVPPRPREFPAERSGWSEPGYGAQRELPAGRSSWSEEREPRQNGYAAPEPDGWSDRIPRQNGYGGPETDRGPRQNGYGAPDRQGGYGAPEPRRDPRPGGYDDSSWSGTRQAGGARELPSGSASREPAFGMRELPAAPQRRDDGYDEPDWREQRKPAYGAQRELPGGPSSWAGQESPAFDEETDRYGNPRRRDDRDEPPFGGGGGGPRGQGDRRAPEPPTGPSWNDGSGPATGWNGGGRPGGDYRRGAAPDGPGYRGAPPDGSFRAEAEGPGGDWRAELSGGTAAPTSGVAGYRAAAGGDWRTDLSGGATVTSAAPVSGYRATATPGGDWRAELNGTATPELSGSAAAAPGFTGTAATAVTSAPPAGDWRAELNGTAAAPTSGAAGYRATAGADWRTDLGVTPVAAPVSGATGYRATTPASTDDDWRRELARDAAPVDGEPQRFSTSDFPPFRPSGTATVNGGSNLALSATSVIATPPASPEEDTSWPPRRGVSGALFENTGSYERRPVSSGVLSGRQNDLLDPDDEDEDQKSNSPLAAVGYTVVWYGVPVVLFVLGILLLNGGQRAHALQTLANAAPEFGISLVLSIMVAFGLRFATTAWKSASVGLAAAVVGAGLATVLNSAITGNSLS
ncbi:hypothetical protein Acy02nite_45850 [Actinoplanes cyaneus]|uniref:Uncharacterized protein n=1 Tax=Actinoplanes cyaneus TaxID=52696 RepID=A0A919IJ27_9ACTN|nr:hypothetical protein [Actinoplanes cyaneus]MCW2138953.1 hypothetical protein [Actinoplanes cyaneus]GID66704.1 hypothetical protein Acy02nite_45850 [Actinoplanes cyaneus]